MTACKLEGNDTDFWGLTVISAVLTVGVHHTYFDKTILKSLDEYGKLK